MRSSRMRGYGAWTMGWREGERRSGGGGGGGGNGCAFVMVCLAVLFMFSCIKVVLETGNVYALLIGIAVIAGVVQGLNK